MKTIKDALGEANYEAYFKVQGTVSFGEDDLVSVQTYTGPSNVKQDCFLEDATGISRFDVWE